MRYAKKCEEKRRRRRKQVKNISLNGWPSFSGMNFDGVGLTRFDGLLQSCQQTAKLRVVNVQCITQKRNT
jgi:hypothetical protein